MQVCPLAESGNLAPKSFPNWWGWLTVVRMFIETMWFMVNIYLPPWSLELWYKDAKPKMPMRPAPNKSLELWFSNRRTWAEILHTYFYIFLLPKKKKYIWEKVREFVHRFLQNPLGSFSLDDTLIYPFTVRGFIMSPAMCWVPWVFFKDSPKVCGLEDLQRSAGMGFTRTITTHWTIATVLFWKKEGPGMMKSLSLGDYEVTCGTKEQLNCYLLWGPKVTYGIWKQIQARGFGSLDSPGFFGHNS